MNSTAIPIAIRSRVELPAGMDEWIQRQLLAKLGHALSLIVRATVRFEDVNGPRGGIDTVCRVKLVMRGRPSVQVEELAATPREAFTAVLPVLTRNLDRMRSKHGLRGNRRPAHPEPPRRPKAAADDAGEIIGRRAGRGASAVKRALARPEKKRRDAYVDTASPGTSASDRRAGGSMSARRNTLGKPSRATATLEDSRTKPSRKSTRRSATRGKPSQGKERTAVSRSLTPSARAARGAARRR